MHRKESYIFETEKIYVRCKRRPDKAFIPIQVCGMTSCPIYVKKVEEVELNGTKLEMEVEKWQCR